MSEQGDVDVAGEVGGPRVSVLTAVFDPEPAHLAECVVSVAAQTLADHEHILVDDGSTAPHVATMLAAFERAWPNVRVISRSSNGGIVAASADALAAASGEFVAFVDHDDGVVIPSQHARHQVGAGAVGLQHVVEERKVVAGVLGEGDLAWAMPSAA